MAAYKQIMSDYLPERLPASLRRERERITEFPGAREGRAGIVTAMTNLSPRCAPALATRLPRGVFASPVGSGTPHGLAFFDGRLFFARGTRLYATANGVSVSDVGAVSDTDKRFFVMGDRLYVLPDKAYVDKGGTALCPVELDTGVLEKVEFTGSKAILPEGVSWTGLGFAVGDGLRVVNADDAEPAPEGDYRIAELHGREATVVGEFPAPYTSNARFQRKFPDLERVCVSGNRVFGIAGRDVYVSAAGSALDFYSRQDRDGQGPAVLRADTEGDFTACAAWQGYVVCFKADRICKLVGSRSDSFGLQDTAAVGIPARLADTLCEVDGALCYCADGGVYRYRGQQPARMASAGDRTLTRGYGGTDGARYYLAVETRDGVWRQYVYDPEDGCRYDEDDLKPAGMMSREGFLWIQGRDGYVWMTASDGRMAETASDERSVKGAVRSSVTLAPDYDVLPDGCRPTEVLIRATADAGATLEVRADYADGGAGKDADGTAEVVLGSFTGRMQDRLLRIPLTPRRCDGMRLRLVMTGGWVIREIIREYERGSR